MDKYMAEWDAAVERCLAECDEEGLLELLKRAEQELGEELTDEVPSL
jgi:hypothetical protein